MATEILLVRHGQTKSNFTGYYMGWSNEDLDSEGLAQAQKVSARLAAISIASVYSSPLQRALSTAQEIAKPHNLEVKVLEDLIEIKIGDWQGLHISEIRQRWPDLWQQWRTDPSSFTMPGGESFSQLAERVSRAVKKILQENPDVKVIVVSHEIVIKAMIMQALGASYNIYRRFEISNASLSLIQSRNDRLRVVTVNDKSHIEG